MSDPDEADLIAASHTTPAAFVILYERYVDRIYGFCLRRTRDDALARDITSATFEKALVSLRKYQWRGVSFGAWLYKIARNEIAQYYRRHFWLPLLDRYQSDQDVEQVVQINEQNTALYAALEKLSSADRDVITLRYFESLSSVEVAEILGCSVENVYLRLHRALSRLRHQLETQESNKVNYVHE